MTDRDHFAAAALTGLLAQGDDGSFSEESYVRGAYRWADAMLRERAKTNHDAAPAARASEATASPERVCVRSDAGTGDTQSFDAYRRFVGEVMNWISEATSAYAASCRSDGGMKIMADACSRCWDAFDRIAHTDHGASPEARASVDSVAPQPTTRGDSDRTDKAAPRPSEGTGDTPDSPKPIKGGVSDRSKPINGPDPDSRVWETPVHTPAPHATPGEGSVRREGTEPVAWALMRHGKAEQVAVHPVYLSGDIHRVAPLYAYQPPMLTAAERDAIQTAMNAYGSDNANPECAAIEATLWGLLERTK